MLTSNLKKHGMSETTGLGGLDVAWGIFTMGHTQQKPLGPLGSDREFSCTMRKVGSLEI